MYELVTAATQVVAMQMAATPMAAMQMAAMRMAAMRMAAMRMAAMRMATRRSACGTYAPWETSMKAGRQGHVAQRTPQDLSSTQSCHAAVLRTYRRLLRCMKPEQAMRMVMGAATAAAAVLARPATEMNLCHTPHTRPGTHASHVLVPQRRQARRSPRPMRYDLRRCGRSPYAHPLRRSLASERVAATVGLVATAAEGESAVVQAAPPVTVAPPFAVWLLSAGAPETAVSSRRIP